MSAMTVGLALLAPGTAPVIGQPLPDQTVHLRPGEFVTIRLDGGAHPTWVIASVGRTDALPSEHERALNRLLVKQQPALGNKGVAPPTFVYGKKGGYESDTGINTQISPEQAAAMKVETDLPEGVSPDAPPVAPDVVKLSLKPAPIAPGMMLLIENGYTHFLRYRAVLHRNGRRQPTDVCEALDKVTTVEHWPYPFESIDLSAFEITNKGRGEDVVCR